MPRTLSVFCVGMRPLLMNSSFKVDVPEKLSVESSAQEQAQAKLWLDSEGRPSISSERILACLDEALRQLRLYKLIGLAIGKSGVSSYLAILGSDHPLINQGEDGAILPGSPDWEVDVRRWRLLLERTKVKIIRPKFKNWAFAFELVLADSITDEQAIQIIKSAGLLGLGDFRRAGFGQFRLHRVEILQAA